MASKLYKNVIKPAWGDIQDTRGNHYVPDAIVSMSLATLKNNRGKAAEALAYWSADPCSRPNDSMCAEKNNGDIVSTLRDMKSFLTAKVKAYDDLIAALSPVPTPVLTTTTTNPGSTTTAPVLPAIDPITQAPVKPVTSTPGASEGTATDPATTTGTPTTGGGATTPAAKKKVPMWAWIAGGVLVAVIAGALLIKKKKP